MLYSIAAGRVGEGWSAAHVPRSPAPSYKQLFGRKVQKTIRCCRKVGTSGLPRGLCAALMPRAASRSLQSSSKRVLMAAASTHHTG